MYQHPKFNLSESEYEAYENGITERLKGNSIQANPYLKKTRHNDLWDLGWIDTMLYQFKVIYTGKVK